MKFFRKTLTLAALLLISTSAFSSTKTIIDDNTRGYYNESVGTILNSTSEAFPTADNRLDLDFPEQPNLSPAESQLGGWLQNPPLFMPSMWSKRLIQIPKEWSVDTETAIVYKINAPSIGYKNMSINIGVDNGVFVWLDGQYLGGHLREGGVIPNEHQFTFNFLAAGAHYLQILREDHGAADGFTINVTVDADPIITIENASITPVRVKQGDQIDISAKISGNPDSIGEVVFLLGSTQLTTLTDPDGDGTWTGQYQTVENPGYKAATKIYVKSPTGKVIARWPGFTVTQ